MQEIIGFVDCKTLVAFRIFPKVEIPVKKGSRWDLVVRQCKLSYIGAKYK